MKSTGVLILLVAMAFATGCSRSTQEQPAAAASETSSEPESRIKRSTNGEVIVTLDAETQKIMGLQAAPLQAAQLKPERKCFGRVLDASPLTALAAEWMAAQATREASQEELKRLQTLATQENASQRALQTAQATAARENALTEAARLKLMANWGGAISDRKDLPDLLRSLSSLSACLVELDLPAGESLPSLPTGARLLTLADSGKAIAAELLGPAPMVDPQLQARGFLLLVNPNVLQLTPGTAVTGLLMLPGLAEQGVAVPQDALVRFNGTTWIYLQTGEGTFQRAEVALESPLENGWFVRQRLKPGDKVVIVGAQQLLSEELKNVGGEE